jgi:hypothetical protein
MLVYFFRSIKHNKYYIHLLVTFTTTCFGRQLRPPSASATIIHKERTEVQVPSYIFSYYKITFPGMLRQCLVERTSYIFTVQHLLAF